LRLLLRVSAEPCHLCWLLLLSSYGCPRDLHSFPTRRSSDLLAGRAAAQVRRAHERPEPSYAQQGVRRGRTVRDRRRPEHRRPVLDRKSTRLNSSHVKISYAVFCLKKKKKKETRISQNN